MTVLFADYKTTGFDKNFYGILNYIVLLNYYWTAHFLLHGLACMFFMGHVV